MLLPHHSVPFQLPVLVMFDRFCLLSPLHIYCWQRLGSMSQQLDPCWAVRSHQHEEETYIRHVLPCIELVICGLRMLALQHVRFTDMLQRKSGMLGYVIHSHHLRILECSRNPNSQTATLHDNTCIQQCLRAVLPIRLL